MFIRSKGNQALNFIPSFLKVNLLYALLNMSGKSPPNPTKTDFKQTNQQRKKETIIAIKSNNVLRAGATKLSCLQIRRIDQDVTVVISVSGNCRPVKDRRNYDPREIYCTDCRYVLRCQRRPTSACVVCLTTKSNFWRVFCNNGRRNSKQIGLLKLPTCV